MYFMLKLIVSIYYMDINLSTTLYYDNTRNMIKSVRNHYISINLREC